MRLWACLYGKGAISNDNIIIIIIIVIWSLCPNIRTTLITTIPLYQSLCHLGSLRTISGVPTSHNWGNKRQFCEILSILFVNQGDEIHVIPYGSWMRMRTSGSVQSQLATNQSLRQQERRKILKRSSHTTSVGATIPSTGITQNKWKCTRMYISRMLLHTHLVHASNKKIIFIKPFTHLNIYTLLLSQRSIHSMTTSVLT